MVYLASPLASSCSPCIGDSTEPPPGSYAAPALLVREAVPYPYGDRTGSTPETFPAREDRTVAGAGFVVGSSGPCCHAESEPQAGASTSTSVPDASSDAEAPAPRVSVSDPFSDADALEELEEEITTLAAHIHAATHRLLTLIAEFDRRRGWELGGHRSPAHWLSFRTGVDLGTAREKVRAARALSALPRTSASMARGELSFSKVRALTRVATRDNEADLLDLARGCTTAQLERMVRGFRRGGREDEEALERRRHEERALSVFPDEDGMYVVKGRLPAEVGALLMRAVEAASDALYREEREWRPDYEVDSQKAATQRRADALGLLAERALAAGFGSTSISGTRAQRYQVVLHVEAGTLDAGGEPGRSELEDGTRVSAETSRRLSCDAGLVRVRHAPDGSVFDSGRRTRTISPALRRALEARDRGCRFPGCGLRFTDAHHVTHWADGGETSLANCVLLCRHHHRLVHEGRWTVGWWGPGRAVFFDPRGGTHFDGRWRPPGEVVGEGTREKGWDRGSREKAADGGSRDTAAVGELGTTAAQDGPREKASGEERRRGERKDVSAETSETASGGTPSPKGLMDENRRRGVRPSEWTAGARWKREADIPDSVWFRALEALG